MKINLAKYASYCLLVILSSCRDEGNDIIMDSRSFIWQESSLPLATAMDVYKFKKGDDGQLYLLGWNSENTSIFAKLVGEQWETIAEVDEFVIGDFAVFKDTVYFSTSLAVKKSKGLFVDTFITTSTHSSIETFENKLFIGGSHLYYDGGDYSLLTYDTSYELTPVSVEGAALHFNIANKKLFVLTYDGFQVYDKYGHLEDVPYSIFNRELLNISEAEEIYGVEKSGDNGIVITAFLDKKVEQIGNTLPDDFASITSLQFFDTSLIFVAQKFSEDTSTAFFLTTNNTWKSIASPFVIYDIINYGDKMLAGTKGKIMELREE